MVELYAWSFRWIGMLSESALTILVPIYKGYGEILILSCYRAIVFLRHSMMVGKLY